MRKPHSYPKPGNKIGSLSYSPKRLWGEAISTESYASFHGAPPGLNPSPRNSVGSLLSGLSSWDSSFYLKQKVQSAFRLNLRTGKGSQAGSGWQPSPPLLGPRPQDGMHCTRSGPSSSSDVSEELGDSSESASVAPTPGSRQRL